MRLDEIPISCMSMRMEISLDGSSKTSKNEKSIEEQIDQILEEKNKEFYNAHKENEKKH